jgi:hypothetical protein
MELLAVDVDGGEMEMERKRERGRPQEALQMRSFTGSTNIFLCITFWFAFWTRARIWHENPQPLVVVMGCEGSFFKFHYVSTKAVSLTASEPSVDMIKVLESNNVGCSKILTQDLLPGDTSIPKFVNIQSLAWREKHEENHR